MTEIDEESYYSTLEKLYRKKWESLKSEKNRFVKLKKTRDYLLQKGYEMELIGTWIKGFN
jgi:regulatory protein